MTVSRCAQILNTGGSVQPRPLIRAPERGRRLSGSRARLGCTPKTAGSRTRYGVRRSLVWRSPSPLSHVVFTRYRSLRLVGSFVASVLQVHRCYVRCVAGLTRSPLQCCNGVAASPSTVNRIGVSPFPFAFALLKPHTARLAYVVLKCQRTSTRRRLVSSRTHF